MDLCLPQAAITADTGIADVKKNAVIVVDKGIVGVKKNIPILM